MIDLVPLEQTLKKEMPDALSGYTWSKARLYGPFSPSGGGLSLSYSSVNSVFESPIYLNEEGRERIRRIPSSSSINMLLIQYCIDCQQAGVPWNEATFILDQDGNIEHSFVMNWQRVFQDKIDRIQTAVSGVAEMVYERLATEPYSPNEVWEAATVTLAVSDGIVTVFCTHTLHGNTLTFKLPLSKPNQKMWLQYHNMVNSGELKGHFPAWNTIIMQLPYQEIEFDEEKHVRYQVR